MIELLLLGQIGVLLHYLKEWVLTDKQGKKYELKKAIPMALLSSITTILLIYLKEDIKDLYPITKFNAIVTGYVGNSIFFSFIDVRKPKGISDQIITP